jgi:hypothetical protein
VRAKSTTIEKAKLLDDLDETLTNSSKIAATFGDEFLVYLIGMAVLHARKAAIHLDDGPEHRLSELPHKRVANFEVARSHLSSLSSGIRSMSAFHSSVVQ